MVSFGNLFRVLGDISFHEPPQKLARVRDVGDVPHVILDPSSSHGRAVPGPASRSRGTAGALALLFVSACVIPPFDGLRVYSVARAPWWLKDFGYFESAFECVLHTCLDRREAEADT